MIIVRCVNTTAKGKWSALGGGGVWCGRGHPSDGFLYDVQKLLWVGCDGFYGNIISLYICGLIL